MKKMYLFEKFSSFFDVMFDSFTDQEDLWFHPHYSFLEMSSSKEITISICLGELKIIAVGFSNLD